MARIFNRLRLSQIGGGSFHKYLLYAIGEILLVVVGILFALNINDKSEDTKKRKEETRVLYKLSRDLENDLTQLEFNISSTKEKMLIIDSLFAILYDPKPSSLQQFIGYNLHIPYVDYFIENRGTFEEGVSSGKISYIKTDSIREGVFEYYRFVQQSRTDAIQIKFVEDIIVPQWGELVIPTQEGLSYLGFKNRMPSIEIEDFSKNKKYIQLIAQKYGTSQVQIENWNRIIKRATRMKMMVDSELVGR